MLNYLVVVYNEKTKKIDYEEVENVDNETNPGDIAIQIINTLPKHEKLINFWPLWEKNINDIK